MNDPEDYAGGMSEMIADDSNTPYRALAPLSQRKTTEIKLRAPGGVSEAEMAAKFGFSQPIAMMFKMTQKMYGYMKDGNIQTDLEHAALDGANRLNDIVLDAPCLNREGRYAYEEARAQDWLKSIKKLEDVDDLLEEWSAANAYMLQAQIVEDQEGFEAAEPLYKEFLEMKQQQKNVQMKAAKLPPADNMYFRCRVKQYEIMRERQYDLAMGYPTHDVTELKHKLSEGGDVHDLVPEMTWPWKLGYNLVTRSTSDGEAWRTVMMHWYAQQAPQQQTPQWGAPPGYYPPFMNNGMAPDGEQDPDEPPDKRKAIFGFFGNKNGHKPQQEPDQKKKPRRRSRGKR